MEYKYNLPVNLIEKVTTFEEFANGGAQATIELNDGRIFMQALLSNSKAIIALRGHHKLPFEIKEILNIYQTEEDKNPIDRDSWEYWDEW